MRISKEKITIFIVAIIIACCLLPISAMATPQITINNTFPNFSLSAAAYGNNTYVAVGSYGYIVKSSDALNWSIVQDGTNYNYNGVVFGNNQFVATAPGGKIRTSPDGTTWTERTSGTAYDLGKIIYTGSKFYVVGSHYDNNNNSYGVVLTSTDGTSWNSVDMGVTGRAFSSVAYGNNMVLIGDRNGYVHSSTNGTSWTHTQIASVFNSMNFVTYLNNKFYTSDASAYLYYSTNGTTWTAVGSPFRVVPSGGCAQAFCGLYDGTKYYLFGFDGDTYGGVLTSTNGTSFSATSKNTTMVCQNCLYANGKYIQVGNDGMVVSSDGVNWHYAYVSGNFSSVTYDGSKYIAAGYIGSDGEIYTSTDLNSWTLQNVPLVKSLYSIAFGGGKYVAVGNADSTSKGSILKSTDGQNWSLYHSPQNGDLWSIAYGNNIFIAVGANGSIISSSDGQAWTSRNYDTNYIFYAVAYVNNRFVACGDNGKIYYSTDGASWTNISYSDTTVGFYGVAYGEGKYVFVGYDADYYAFTMKSTDLTSYSLPTNQVAGLGMLYGISYANGTFMAIANDLNDPYNAFITTSTDGDSWTNTDCNNTNYLSGINYANNSFRVVGSPGLAMSVSVPTPNTTPSFVGSTTTLIVKQSASATDVKSLLAISDTDASQTLTWSQSVAPDHGGTLTITNATASSGSSDIAPSGTITYQPAPGYTGTETFTVQVSDGTTTATRQITVTVEQTYTVTYNGNGSTGGNLPTDNSNYSQNATVTVLSNTGSLTKTGYTFSGWNTATGGTGTDYSANSNFNMGTANVTLYAKWTAIPADTATASATSLILTAGASDTVTLKVYDSLGNIDTSFSGAKAVTVSGYTMATDGTYGNVDSTSLTASSTLVNNVTFTSGVASLNLALNNAAAQTIVFSVAGVNTPASLSITVINANHPPIVSDYSKKVTRDQVMSFTVADFTDHYSDSDNDSLNKIKIINLPANGTILVNSTAVLANQEIVAADLSNLFFQPSTGWIGITSFGWQVSDSIAWSTSISTVGITVKKPILKGDGNDDGTINMADALMVQKYMVGKMTLTPDQMEALDCDSDGKIDSADYQWIVNKYLGKI